MLGTREHVELATREHVDDISSVCCSRGLEKIGPAESRECRDEDLADILDSRLQGSTWSLELTGVDAGLTVSSGDCVGETVDEGSDSWKSALLLNLHSSDG